MMRRALAFACCLALGTSAGAVTANCQFEPMPAGAGKLGPWIDKDNWLNPEYRRVGLQAAPVFMPSLRLKAVPANKAAPAGKTGFDAVPVLDPLDGAKRDLAFLLDSQLHADGLVVMRNGRVLEERYRNGLRAEAPRLLLDATRPLLNLIGAIGIAQGKLVADKSLARSVPALANIAGLRKLSVQRLLDGPPAYPWTDADIAAWNRASGWQGADPGGLRAWLSQAKHWEAALTEARSEGLFASPEDDLLSWVLSEGYGKPTSRVFCEQLLQKNRPEDDVIWLGDAKGIELGGGLGLSLRDFAKIGQTLIDARISRNRNHIPAWFIETITAPSGSRVPEIRGLSRGSEQRYGFYHLGGAASRVAIIGGQGASLFIDFDRRLVIALYANFPVPASSSQLATLESVWAAIAATTR